MQYEIIKRLRFPLILGVILIHSQIISPSEATAKHLFITSIFVKLFSQLLTKPCVPLFFFFSGFLFFRNNHSSFLFDDYSQKIRKRTKTLLVPYIFWNALVLIYFAIIHKFMPSFINPDMCNIYHYSWKEWLLSFWNFPGGQPVCYQLWFIRDLMIVIMFAPVLWYISRCGNWIAPIAIVCLFLSGIKFFPFYIAFSFFILGSSFAVQKWDFEIFANRTLKYALPIFCFCIFFNLVPIKCEELWGVLSQRLSVVSGMICYIALCSRVNFTNNISDIFTQSSFFLYAFHGFPIVVIKKIIIAVIAPASEIMWIMAYLGTQIFVLSLGIGIYVLLSKHFPHFTQIITGGRSNV